MVCLDRLHCPGWSVMSIDDTFGQLLISHAESAWNTSMEAQSVFLHRPLPSSATRGSTETRVIFPKHKTLRDERQVWR